MNSALHNQVIYLEQYIESTYFIPTELSRMLNTIKALDEKCCDLSDRLHETTGQLMAMPPAFQQAPGPEYFSLMKTIAADQKQLTQFSEEKVQLAQQAYDLLEMHALELERTMESFESDMRVGGMQLDPDLNLAGLEGMGDLYTPAGGFDLQRGRTPKLEDWNLPTPTDAFASLPLPMVPGLPPPLPGLQATIQATSTAGPGQARRTNSLTAAPPARNLSQKRPQQREDAIPFPPPQPPQPPIPPAPQQVIPAPPLPPQPPPPQNLGVPPIAAPGYKKRAPSVGSMLNSMGSLPNDDSLGFPAAPPPAPPSESLFTEQHQQAVVGNQEPTSGPIGFMSSPPNGLKNKSPHLQVPGRILDAAGIGPSLRGRHAELFWPDDDSWYLIEVQSIDPDTRKASIMYMTGEVEELDLVEIVRDRHMSLIPPEFYGVQA